MKKKTIFFGEPEIGKDEEKAVLKVLRSKWLGFGKESQMFESELKDYTGAKDAVVVSSCTAALHLSLVLNNIGPGDEVITTSLTFAATANVILYCGATPILVDIDPKTLNIDPQAIERAITPKTKAIIVVHYGGLPCDMEEIERIAKNHKLFIVEDAAHAIGAKYKGVQIGGSGNFVCFSFYSNKNITSVEGGLLTLKDKDQLELAKVLRMHGLQSDAWKRWSDTKILTNETVALGFKYNITDLGSAIGRVQLRKLEKHIKKREIYAKLYDETLRGIDGVTLQPKHGKGLRHALHLYTVVIDPEKHTMSREEIIKMLRKEGIFAVVHYKPLHTHPLYKKLPQVVSGDFRHADKVGNNILTLPLLPQMTLTEAKYVAETAKRILLRSLNKA
jgi:dTDP-4-amino-4,6-dideoxygalactose transaminase